MRQLVGMPTMLDDQRRFDQRHRKITGDAQPEVVVFANRQRLVEAAAALEQFPGHHRGGRTDQTEIETALKNISRRLAMLQLRIDPHAVANPDLVGLANLHFSMALHKCHLHLQLVRLPEIVRIEEREQPAAALANAEIARRRHPAPILIKVA